MTISIKPNRGTHEVLVGIENIEEKHKRAIDRAWFDVGEEVVDETRRLIQSGKRTGKVYSYMGRPHRASAPGEVPANRSGKLARSGNYSVVNWNEMIVGETEEYAKMENKEGYGRIKSRPHIIKAIKNKGQDTVNILEEAIDRGAKS